MILLFWIFWGLLSRHCLSVPEYVTQPKSLNASLNSTATFSCEAIGVSLIFYYVGENMLASEVTYVNRGFYEGDQKTFNGTLKRRELSIYAQEINNNTIISCGTIPGNIRSENAILIIQGLLADVGDLKYTFINGSSVLLTWTPPYTLNNVPITGYYINDNIFTSNNSIVLSTTDPDPCILTNVTVSPVNDAGIGETNSIDFYYQKVPFITPAVNLIPMIHITRHQLSLNVTIDVSELCIGEYPNSIMLFIMNANKSMVIYSDVIFPIHDVSYDQLAIIQHTSIKLINTTNTFIINILLSNYGENFNNISSFVFGFLGPVANIESSIDNCSNISVYWDSPVVHDRVFILYYNLSIYDNVTGNLVDNVHVYDGTSYQFEDEDIFIHHYTYVITGINELGKGISNKKTFFYARVPRPVELNETAITLLNYTRSTVNYKFATTITVQCTGENPENATVTIFCNETSIIFRRTYILEYYGSRQIDLVGVATSVPYQQRCIISIILSNEAGNSEPLMLSLDTITPHGITTSTIVTPSSVAPSSVATNSNIIVSVVVPISTAVALSITCLIMLMCFVYQKKKRINRSEHSICTVPNAAYEDINKFQLNTNNNPAYGQIRETSNLAYGQIREARQNVTYEEIIL